MPRLNMKISGVIFLFQFFPRDHEMFKRLEYPKLEYFPTVLGQGTKSMTPSFETGK